MQTHQKALAFLFLIALIAPACSIWYMSATGLSNQPEVVESQPETVWWFNKYGHRGDFWDYRWTGWAATNKATPEFSIGSDPQFMGVWAIGGSSVWVPVRASDVPFSIKVRLVALNAFAWVLLLGILIGLPILAIIGEDGRRRPTVRRRGGGGYVAMREIFSPVR